MGKYKIVRYDYADVEMAIKKCSEFINLYKTEKVYSDHEIRIDKNKVILIFQLHG